MSALALRIIATLSMLIDHIGYCFNIDIFRIVGRLAFPLYVFLMVNGFRHTKNRKKYALRMGIFAIISQIPFQLMRHVGILSFEVFLKKPALLFANLNVMVTLLLGLLVIWLCDAMRRSRYTRCLCLLPAIAMFFAYYKGLISSDYGAKGILLATVFWFFDGNKIWTSIGLIFAMYYDLLVHYAYRLLHGLPVGGLGYWHIIQLAVLLVLPLIFLYNGKSGNPKNLKAKKAIQIGFYAFYPAHMLLLWAIAQFTAYF